MERPERLLTVAEAAELLGITRNQLYIWTREGRIPSFKLNSVVRFRRSDLEAWMEANRRGPVPAAG